jgi:hypothetical protein
MPITEGEVTLNFDGTFQASRKVSSRDIIDVFSALEPPGGGRVWWKIFAANSVFRNAPHEYDIVMAGLGFDRVHNKNEYYAAKNNKLIDWILKERLHEVISFSVFADARKHFWHGRPYDCPASKARKLIDYAFKHRNPDKKTLVRLAEA